MLNESNIPLEEDGIEEEILVDEEVAITKAMWGDVGGNIENQTDLQNALDAKQDSLTEAQLNAVNSGITSEKVTTYDGYADQIASKADQSALNAESVARGEADMALGTRIDNEALARQQADNGLQSQIDAITSKSDVVDVVANYAALQAYDTSTLGNNDVVKVLDDETHEDALTYYRWSTTTQTWTYIGQEAPYYSKSQTDTLLLGKQNTIDSSHKLSADLVDDTSTTNKFVTASDITNWNAKQDALTAGTGIDITGGVISTPAIVPEVVAELPTTGAEGKLYLTPKAHTTSTATGNPIEATITAQAGQLESFQLDGDTFQQSYTGKNLYNIEAIPYVWRRAYSSTGEELSWSGYVGTDAYQPVEPNTQYALWNNKPGNTTYLCEYDENKNFIQRLIAVTTFTTTATTKYLRWSLSVGDGEIPPTQTQLELGSKTSYEPFVGGQPSPSPDYPQPIRTVTGEQTVTIVGKNLYDKSTDTIGGYLDTSGNAVSTGTWSISGYITVEAGAKYTISGVGTPGIAPRYCYYDSNKQFVSSVVCGNKTITIPSGVTYIRLSVYNGTGGTAADDTATLQLELGESASSYAPYSSTAYPISLGSIELCDIGGYQDYIHKVGEDWIITKRTASVLLNEGSSIYRANFGSNPFYTPLPKGSEGADDAVNVVSDYFYGITYYDRTLEMPNSIFNTYVDNSPVLYIRNTPWATIEDFKSWLSEHNVKVYSKRTPIDTTITDTNLIAQLEAIRTASLENGTNTITNTATGTNLAGDMEIDYYGFNPRNRYDKWLWLDINNNYEQIGGE